MVIGGQDECAVLTVERKKNAGRVRRYQGLQILRITAAIMVLVTHSSFYARERLDPAFGIWGGGASGVDIFFVLSGFVMVASSTQLFGDAEGWKEFASRRILRIVPIYWIATTAKVAAVLLTSGYVLHTGFSATQVIASYLFIPAMGSEGDIAPVVGVGWTLNFEMFFYLLFALALLLRVNVYRFVGGVLGLLALGAFLRQPHWPAASFYLDTRVIQFFYGMLIARACFAGRKAPRWVAMMLLGLGLLGLMASWPPLDWLHGLHYGVAAAMVVYGMASLEDSLPHIPRVVLYGADASYVIYLFHPFIAPAVPVVLRKMHMVQPILSVACSVALALLGGCLIHAYLEKPITDWLRGRFRVDAKPIARPAMTA